MVTQQTSRRGWNHSCVSRAVKQPQSLPSSLPSATHPISRISAHFQLPSLTLNTDQGHSYRASAISSRPVQLPIVPEIQTEPQYAAINLKPPSAGTTLREDDKATSQLSLRLRSEIATDRVKVNVVKSLTPTIVVPAPFALPRGKEVSFRFRQPLVGNKYARVTVGVDPNDPPSQHECRLHPNFDYTFVASGENETASTISGSSVNSRGTHVTMERCSNDADGLENVSRIANGSPVTDETSSASDTIPPCLPPLLTYVPVSVTNINYPPVPLDDDEATKTKSAL